MTNGFKFAHKEHVRDQTLVVVEPKRPTEFEIQATLWVGLRALGINARGEVKTKFAGRSQVRFDVAVFETGGLVGVLEIKREGKQLGTDWTTTRQGQRYGQFGVPVRLVRGMSDAEAAIEDARNGRLWKQDG